MEIHILKTIGYKDYIRSYKNYTSYEEALEEGIKYTLVDYEKLKKLNDKYIPLKDNELVHKYHYNYVDNYDGSIVPCTYWVEEREWRRKWFKWCDWFKMVKRYIEIEFDGEVGKDKGSWKGGCIGCSYNLLSGETPEECIRRMEKERKF